MHEDRGTHFDISLSDRLTLLVTLKCFFFFCFFFSFFCLPSYRFSYFNFFFLFALTPFQTLSGLHFALTSFQTLPGLVNFGSHAFNNFKFFSVFFYLVDSSMIVLSKTGLVLVVEARRMCITSSLFDFLFPLSISTLA